MVGPGREAVFMIRPASVLGCVVLAGCQPPAVPPTAEPASPPGESAGPAAGPTPAGFPIDYAGWPSLTAEPVAVEPRVFTYCRIAPEAEVLGPHFAPFVRYYADRANAASFRAGTFPVPVSTMIVKEKYWEMDGKLHAVAAMIKREAGYDPAHGDWEYVYTTLGDQPVTQRGTLESCIACHRIKKEQDFLYRTYLGGKKK